MSNQYTKSNSSNDGLLEYKKYHYFYKITNLTNNHFYYGIHSTDDLDDGYKGSGLRLQQAYRKYLKENFKKEILKFFQSRKEASEYEATIVTEELVNDENCYNMTEGGDKGFCTSFRGKHHTFDTKLKIGEKLRLPNERLKQKRRIMSKDGLIKSIKIEDIEKYQNNGWKLGRHNACYLHSQEEYLNILKRKKRKRIEKENQTRQKHVEENTKIHDLLLNIAKNDEICLDKFGWNTIIIKILNDNGIMTKSNIRRFIKNHCPEFFEYKKVYDKK